MKNTKKFIAKVQVRGEQIDNILCTAFEGGSNYWVESVSIIGEKPKGCTYSSEVISRGGRLKFTEQSEDGLKALQHILTLEMMLKGIALMIENAYPFDDAMDAGEADMCLQYALFGKIIYG